MSYLPHYSATTSRHPELEVAFVPFSGTHRPITLTGTTLYNLSTLPSSSLSLCIIYILAFGYVTQLVDESTESGGENCSLLPGQQMEAQNLPQRPAHPPFSDDPRAGCYSSFPFFENVLPGVRGFN